MRWLIGENEHNTCKHVSYCRKFSLDKNFAQPSYPCITQTIYGIKSSPMKTGVKKGKNFLQAKISSYTTVTLTYLSVEGSEQPEPKGPRCMEQSASQKEVEEQTKIKETRERRERGNTL